MLNPKIEQAIARQINAEIYSAYLYLAMSAWCQSANRPGAASWFRIQAQEELSHVDKFFNYVHERGGRVILTAVDAPPAEWGSLLEVFEATLAHEQTVTGLINDLVSAAQSENDHATVNFLQWFVAEQVEEEASADEVVQKLKMVGDHGGGLFMLDKELAARIFTPPTA